MEWKKSLKRNEKNVVFFGKNKTSVLSLQGCTVFPMIRPSNQKQEKKAILHNLALHIWISSTF